MRNKLSFDLQLSARKAAIAERIAAHKIARSKVSVFLMAMSAGVFMAIGFTFYLSVIADAPSSQALTHLVGGLCSVSYTHLTLPTTIGWCRSRWSPYH